MSLQCSNPNFKTCCILEAVVLDIVNTNVAKQRFEVLKLNYNQLLNVSRQTEKHTNKHQVPSTLSAQKMERSISL